MRRIPIRPHTVPPPRLRGKWAVRHNLDDDPDGRGHLIVEDDEGCPIALVPFGGEGRLGYVVAEQVAREIAALPGREA